MALDPFMQQLWANLHDPSMAGMGQLQAANLLAERLGIPVDWTDPNAMVNSVRAAYDARAAETPASPPTSTGTAPSDPNAGPAPGLVDQLRSAFPWLSETGLSPEFFHELVATSAGAAEIYSKLRQTQQYKQRFQGITRADGTARMTEAQYIATEAAFRQTAAQFGEAARFLNRESLIGLFENEVDPNEFRDRLTVWKKVQEEGGAIKDAFFVYAGIEKSDEDLFEAVVDPAARQKLNDEYNSAVAAAPLDYDTWIGRATTLGMSKVSTQLEGLRKSGALTGQAVQTLLSTDPQFAKQMMDVLYHGGDPTSSETLSLQDLLSTFEYAALGAAARGAGLLMPDRTRVAELRAAGISRSQAAKGYQQYATNQGIYAGAAQRMGEQFGQSDFEKAAFLGAGKEADVLQRAMAAEEAAGRDSGGFGFEQDNAGRLRQGGLRSF
jgi:hypothetical protein